MLENLDTQISPIQDMQTSLSYNVSILIIREFFGKVIAFFGQLLLARILIPQEFGVFAIMAFVINFFLLFSDIGLSPLIIQKNEWIHKKTLAAIFTIKMSLNVLLILALNLLLPLLLFMYQSFNHQYIFMLRIYSIDILIIALQSIPMAISEKHMQYKRISLADVFGMSVYYITACTLALSGFHIWSFIIAVLCKDIIVFLFISIAAKWRPTLGFDRKIIKEITGFGAYMQGTGILNFFYNGIIPIIAGIQNGTKAVGLLTFASNIVGVPESITNNFGRVAFSKFSRIQDDMKILSNLVENSLKSLTTIILLFVVLLFAYGKEATYIFYTSRWLPGISALYWFSAGVIFFPLITTLGQALLAIKRSKDVFYITLVTVICNWILAYLLARNVDFIGIAVASFYTFLLASALYIFAVRRRNFHVGIVKIYSQRILIAGITLIGGLVLNIMFPSFSVILLLCKVVLTVLCYCFLSYIFIKQDFLLLLSRIPYISKL